MTFRKKEEKIFISNMKHPQIKHIDNYDIESIFAQIEIIFIIYKLNIFFIMTNYKNKLKY